MPPMARDWGRTNVRALKIGCNLTGSPLFLGMLKACPVLTSVLDASIFWCTPRMGTGLANWNSNA